MDLQKNVKALQGVGQKTEQALSRLGIETIKDVLHHYPRFYEKYDLPIPIDSIKFNEINVIQGSISSPPQQIRKGRLNIIKTTLKDSSGEISAIWFNQVYLKNKFKIGRKFILRGKIEFKYGQVQMLTPEIYDLEEYNKKIKSLQPIYSLTKGITQNNLRRIINQALKVTYNQLREHWSRDIRTKYKLAEYNYAITQIHYPTNKESLEQARRRLVFDEFVFFQLSLLSFKEEKAIIHNEFNFSNINEIEDVIKSLPYELTNAQKTVWKEIKNDLNSNIVMNRLVQGDVGSGKTIIASLALFYVVKNNCQGCIMAPTEVLAKQHYYSLQELFKPFGIRISMLVGSLKTKEKSEVYNKIKNKEIDIVVGTHALIQEKVEFYNLALIVTDEQHRFGVKQREALSIKGINPHTLVMSATPIPRTLALIIYGDLDVSIIDELPPNRQVIKTYAVETSYRKRIYRFINEEIIKGRQAYIVCPMVDESEELQIESVIEYAKKLEKEFNSNIKIDYLHGKMKPKEKNNIMEKFSENKIQILVSTTVIEVGINVPNATIMVIENSERFGLAQLHQLRGRVGRGKYQSYCILLTDAKNKKTQNRLNILCESNDGFIIAEQDLKLRGQGDLFGIKQHGSIEFKIGDIFQDVDLLKLANKVAKEIINEDPKLKLEKNKIIKERMEAFQYNLEQVVL